MKLCFGAVSKPLPGYAQVDVESGPEVNMVHDLNLLPWPWEPESIESIVAANIVEHLKLNLVEFCNEAWRILKPGGELFVRTPHHDGAESWIDPTHRWHLHEASFQVFDPDVAEGTRNGRHTQFKWRILSLGVRDGRQIHAVMSPRK